MGTLFIIVQMISKILVVSVSLVSVLPTGFKRLVSVKSFG